MIPKIEITDQGIIAPPVQEVKRGWWDIFTKAFGSDLNKTEKSPQGQLVVSLTAVTQDERDAMIQQWNRFDPRYAKGIYQDALGQIYFIDRQENTYSIAPVYLYGLVGVVVPKGFRLSDQSGNFWEILSSVVINPSGVVEATVQAVEAGVIEAAPNTITNIVTALSGLDRVTNPSAAIAGLTTENAENFKARRVESVAANSKNTDASVRGAIANLQGVVDVWVKSNNTDESVVFGETKYSVTRNTILISVVGGSDYDIAWQALVKAGTGCSFAGNTQVKVYDNDTLAVSPPDYDIKFLRPSIIPLKFKIKIEKLSDMTQQDERNMKEAILDALKNGKSRARISQSVRAVQYVVPVAQSTTLPIVSLEVSIDDGTTWHDKVMLGVDQFPSTSAFDIEIAE